jgi:hypothetical protein
MNNETETQKPAADDCLQLLAKFIRQRPGLEYANYGDVKAYRAELRSITADMHAAERLLNFAAIYSGVREYVARELQGSGRLQYDAKRRALDYCTGQYWPTEYRAAAARVLSNAIRAYWRDCGYDFNGIRKQARAEFGRGIASRFFI